MEGKTLKEEVEAMDKRLLDYCAFVESEISALADMPYSDPRKGEHDPTGIGSGLQVMIQRVKNFAWAAQRFPMIDLNLFHQVEQKTIRSSDRMGAAKEVVIWTPKWAVDRYPAGEGSTASWTATDRDLGFFRYSMGYVPQLPPHALDENTRVLEGRWTQLYSPIPPTPLAIRRKVDPFCHRFDNVAVVAEANWASVALKDPLVVGVLHTGASSPFHAMPDKFGFLLGEYDPSKLEKYVIAEFAIKPKE